MTVPIHSGTPVVNVQMNPGDVLFFHGAPVHGSLPNTTADRFRRSLVAHYIKGDSEKVARWYKSMLRMDGSVVELGTSDKGGASGVWVDTDKGIAPIIEVSGYKLVVKTTE